MAVYSLTENEEAEDSAQIANNPKLLKGDKPGVYYAIGIIDYFQLYTFSKATERMVKRCKTCSPNLETSAQPPGPYQNRFANFVVSHFI